MRALAVALVALASGCAQNAFLELQLDLPKNELGGERYAVVRVVSGEIPYEQDWLVDAPLAPFPLDAAQPTVQHVSIEGRDEIETVPVRAKIRFCKDPNCAALGDDTAPEVRLELDRAFYIGKRTSYTWSIPCLPGATGCTVGDKTVTEVPKCGVAGCRAGNAASGNYCVGDKHFCED